MPGHVKKTEGPDPCPDQWLIVSEELKVKLKSKPYDAKKSCWVPNKATGGYDEGLIMEKDGEKITVELLETKEVPYLYYDTSCCLIYITVNHCGYFYIPFSYSLVESV